jgi:hypothetical protein
MAQARNPLARIRSLAQDRNLLAQIPIAPNTGARKSLKPSAARPEALPLTSIAR